LRTQQVERDKSKTILTSMRKIAAAIPLFIFFFSFSLLAADQEVANAQNDPYSGKKIRKVHIEALDAFDPKIPEYRSWPFRFLNKIHVCTNDNFIRRELLFREGDLYDQDIAAETERLLRQNSFLDDIRIQPKLVSPELVDVFVHSEDQWTLQFNVSAGKTKGTSTYDFSVEESNFLGLGKTLGTGYNQEPERNIYHFLYLDPQFLNSRWNLNTNYQNNSDGWRFVSDFGRPFYSLDTKWAYGMAWDSGTFTSNLHYKGKTVAEIDTDHRTGFFFAARSWGERYDKLKVGFVFTTDNSLYPNPARIILPIANTVKAIQKNLNPIDRETYQYGGVVKWDHQHFIEERYLDNFGKIEDLPVGIQFNSFLSYSENINQNPDYLQVLSNVLFSQSDSLQYLSLMAQISGRRELSNGRVNNILFSSYAHYYLKLPPFSVGKFSIPHQTLAANLSTILTRDVDAPFEISLGEDEGLRGYTFKQFTGQNRLLFNVEDRLFTPWNFRLVGIGLVGFMDAGYVWSSEEHLNFRDFGMSVGIGLRLGLKKSQSARVVRIDLAFPLRKETSPFSQPNKHGYSISITSAPIFRAIEAVPKLFRLF
jgi:hypothetical protein